MQRYIDIFDDPIRRIASQADDADSLDVDFDVDVLEKSAF
jgi:hypothetical protein